MKNGIYIEHYKGWDDCKVHYKDDEIYFVETIRLNKRWYKEGKLHREDGPAVEWHNGTKEWRIEGKYHREDGPAIEYVDGLKCWYLNNKLIEVSTQEEFNRYLIMEIFQ